jgi:hypothetical protein
MLQNKWTERVTNEAVLTRVKEKRQSWHHSIKVRRYNMLGHILRYDSLTKNVIEGDVEGYIGSRRPMMEYMKKCMVDIGKDSNKELKKLSYNSEA